MTAFDTPLKLSKDCITIWTRAVAPLKLAVEFCLEHDSKPVSYFPVWDISELKARKDRIDTANSSLFSWLLANEIQLRRNAPDAWNACLRLQNEVLELSGRLGNVIRGHENPLLYGHSLRVPDGGLMKFDFAPPSSAPLVELRQVLCEVERPILQDASPPVTATSLATRKPAAVTSAPLPKCDETYRVFDAVAAPIDAEMLASLTAPADEVNEPFAPPGETLAGRTTAKANSKLTDIEQQALHQFSEGYAKLSEGGDPKPRLKTIYDWCNSQGQQLPEFGTWKSASPGQRPSTKRRVEPEK